MAAEVSTTLWFDGRVEEAAEFYTSLLPDSELLGIDRYPAGSPLAGQALTAHLTIAGVPYALLNGGPIFPPSEFASIAAIVDDQAALDRLWHALIADGGKESACGWCVDRFGVSWQVIPRRFVELAKDPEVAERVFAALMQMGRIDVAALEAAVV